MHTPRTLLSTASSSEDRRRWLVPFGADLYTLFEALEADSPIAD